MLVAGLFLASPAALVIGHVVGGVAALVRMRQAPIKLAFNVAQFALALAALVFHALVPSDDPFSPAG